MSTIEPNLATPLYTGSPWVVKPWHHQLDIVDKDGQPVAVMFGLRPNARLLAVHITNCVEACEGFADPGRLRKQRDALLKIAKRYEELFDEASAEAVWNRKKGRGATDWGKVNDILLGFRAAILDAEGAQ